MANICYKEPCDCYDCPHFRYDDDTGRLACFLRGDNSRLISKAKQRIPQLNILDLENKFIVDIFTDIDEKKYIHFFARGYYAPNIYDKINEYHFAEYTNLIASLESVLDVGVDDFFEAKFDYQYNQAIRDCTESEMMEYYTHYNLGKYCPIPIYLNELNINIPDGMYILL
jgi:hypothetical protein